MARFAGRLHSNLARFRLLLLLTLLASVTALTHCDSGPPANGGPTFREIGCNLCHGENREGTEMGPSLLTVRDNWTAVKLSNYLDDPEGYLPSDERLKAVSTKYSAHMPQLPMTEEQKQVIIEFILKSK